MSKIVTPEMWRERFSVKWPNYYSYEKSDIRKAKDKIEITCPKHGSFFQAPDTHMKSGCMECAIDQRALLHKDSNEEAIARAVSKHGDLYDYTRVDYINNNTPVIIGCKIHGFFSMTMGNHTAKLAQGCSKCGHERMALGQTKTHDQFIADAIRVNGNKVDYSKTVYVSDKQKVILTCPEHGDFMMCASNHLQGQCCRKCAKNGFQVGIPGFFYVLLGDKNTTKVGITNRAVKTRVKEINKSSQLNFKIDTVFEFAVGQTALDLEGNTLTYLRSKYKNPVEKFHGSTESFLDVDLAELLRFIVPQAVSPQ